MSDPGTGSDSPQGEGWWQASDGRWYPPAAYQGATWGQPAPGPTTAEGPFFKRLFDFSMTTFVTPSIVKVLYVIGIVVVSLYAIVFVAAFAQSDESGAIVLGLILVPFVWLLGVIYMRVLVELLVVFFRIENNTRQR